LRQLDVAVLAALRLYDTDDHLRAVDVAGLESNDLTGPQTATIAEREHGVDLEIAGHDKEPLGLIWAHAEGQLLRLLEVVDSAARSCRLSVTRNRNLTPVMMRLRLIMLKPASAKCS
jgi:hypothetical protein